MNKPIGPAAKFWLAFTVLLLTSNDSVAGTKKLTGEEINSLLPTIIVKGEDTRQTFNKLGDTRYVSGGRQSSGSWRTDKDKYCSIWPPSGDWSCYNVFVYKHRDQKRDLLIWSGSTGADVIVNRIFPK